MKGFCSFARGWVGARKNLSQKWFWGLTLLNLSRLVYVLQSYDCAIRLTFPATFNDILDYCVITYSKYKKTTLNASEAWRISFRYPSNFGITKRNPRLFVDVFDRDRDHTFKSTLTNVITQVFGVKLLEMVRLYSYVRVLCTLNLNLNNSNTPQKCIFLLWPLNHAIYTFDNKRQLIPPPNLFISLRYE